jgi:hypothetical protein
VKLCLNHDHPEVVHDQRDPGDADVSRVPVSETFIRSQRNDLSGMRDAAALARCTLAALIAPRKIRRMVRI